MTYILRALGNLLRKEVGPFHLLQKLQWRLLSLLLLPFMCPSPQAKDLNNQLAFLLPKGQGMTRAWATLALLLPRKEKGL